MVPRPPSASEISATSPGAAACTAVPAGTAKPMPFGFDGL